MARQAGNGALLWPVGCSRIEEVPWDLTVAIDHAYLVLRLKENLLKEDTPPDWMWAFDDELQIWFKEVDSRRRSGREPDTELEGTVENEYADRFR